MEADTETMGLLGGVGLRLYFEFLETFAKLFFFLFVLSLPSMLLYYTGDGLEAFLPGFLAKTTFGNLYAIPSNVSNNLFDCNDFENTKCCEKNVSGVIIGIQEDNVPCAKKMQLLLYGMHCNWTFTRPVAGNQSLAFHLCSDTCQQTFDACADVNSMVRAVNRNHGNASGEVENFCAGVIP
eukprot:SAG31_NODE_198_length_20656_cov_5.167291_12_plen_181_part_00